MNTPEKDKVLNQQKSKSYPIAWLVLLIWLAWLANARMGNPAGLPPKFAPAITVPAIDGALGLAAGAEPAPRTSETPPDLSPARRQLAQIPPNPNATLGKGASKPAAPARDSAPVERRATPAAAPVESRTSASVPASTPQRDDQSRGSVAAPASVVAAIRAGDFAAAHKALANDIDAEDAAAMLGEMLSIDEAAGDAILVRRGEEVTLTYNGKARTVVPLRRAGSTLTVRFTSAGIEKEIPIDLSKISDTEKLAFMNRWASDAKSHAIAAVVALRAGDDRAFRIHAADSGALAPYLTPGAK